MAMETLECEEFGEINLRVSSLIEAGELKIDERISSRGFFNVTLRRGEITLRADRYVGLIPLNEHIAIRVRPRASISNLSYMLARSGVAPLAIVDFSRGYLPRLESSENVAHIYARSLIEGCERILSRGLMKGYSEVSPPPPFRGRLLAAETIRRFRARGIKYRHAFSFNTLSSSTVENLALKEALEVLVRMLRRSGDREKLLNRCQAIAEAFEVCGDWGGSRFKLVSDLGRQVSYLPSQLGYYRDPLWTAYLLLQQGLPDVDGDGRISLDSLIIDASKVFEAYARRCFSDRAAIEDWSVFDGNLTPSDFFKDEGKYTVSPDIVLAKSGKPFAVLDAKYKPHPKETDRYELLAFMDALDVKIGGFVCPAVTDETSRYLGTTAGGKAMTVLRLDLAATNPELEADRLIRNVKHMVAGAQRFD